jgi:hypothetical protein
VQSIGFKEEEAVGEAGRQGGLQPLTAPAPDPVSGVVAGVAADAQLVQQRREAVVGRAAPLAAQIHHAAIAEGAAHHPPAQPRPRLQHAHAQPLLLQAACGNQPGEARTNHQHIHPQPIHHRHIHRGAHPASNSASAGMLALIPPPDQQQP